MDILYVLSISPPQNKSGNPNPHVFKEHWILIRPVTE